MAKYLIDVNLPYRFRLWHGSDFIHQSDIDDEASDSSIWDYAVANSLTIVTKDADFSSRILFSKPPPKVIHMRFGNLRIREFFSLISSNWETIVELSSTHKLVNVFLDRIEAIE